MEKPNLIKLNPETGTDCKQETMTTIAEIAWAAGALELMLSYFRVKQDLVRIGLLLQANIDSVSMAERRAGLSKDILEVREQLYQELREKQVKRRFSAAVETERMGVLLSEDDATVRAYSN